MRSPLFSRRHFMWLLWLVLLLPLAQTAATWHMLSHVKSEQLDAGDGQKAIHQVHCDLCLNAAALIGGAPLATTPTLPQTLGHFEAPHTALPDIFTTPAALAYDSRAPPSPLH